MKQEMKRLLPLVLLFGACFAQSNLIQNGDFEFWQETSDPWYPDFPPWYFILLFPNSFWILVIRAILDLQ
jgi:hypothetical protein